MSSLPSPDLKAAANAVEVAQGVIDAAVQAIRDAGGIDANQVVTYDVAHGASAVATAKSCLEFANHGELEAKVACAFIADALRDLGQRILGREAHFGVDAAWMAPAAEFVTTYCDPAFVASLAEISVPLHLEEEFEMVADTFHRFAEEQIRPRAEHVHRTNGDVPEEIIAGLGELGVFGLSIPEEFGGFATGGEDEYLAMILATEALTWGSLGLGGSLITRPEILARALVAGGTQEQKERFLPRLASGELLNAVAVTEPDFGSDVANVSTMASKVEGGWVINGTKTWCTFAARAGVLMLLARTDPDRSKGHRGLSIFVIEKDRGDGHGFAGSQDGAHGIGKMEGRPIDTVGYRGMHSYEISFDNWFVPDENLVGGEEGIGKGFYLQMAGFENGRIQTAARAVGVMQAAYEAALEYAKNRRVFGEMIFEYQLTQAKLGRMAFIIAACRQYMLEVTRMMGRGEGSLEASMAKAYVCRAAEWVTREAMQIHGGMGYAEEYAVSRYFVDARVLSIFEGADETLCLKLIGRRLIEG
jgi:(2S)-methylsuccinyl-CoA dehydrogenase